MKHKKERKPFSLKNSTNKTGSALASSCNREGESPPDDHIPVTIDDGVTAGDTTNTVSPMSVEVVQEPEEVISDEVPNDEIILDGCMPKEPVSEVNEPSFMDDLISESREEVKSEGVGSTSSSKHEAKPLKLHGDEMVSLDGGGNTSIADLMDGMKDGDTISHHCLSPEHSDDNPSAYSMLSDKWGLNVQCNACDFKAYYNPKHSKGSKEKDAELIVIPQIDTASALASIIQCERKMQEVIENIVEHIPDLDIDDVGVLQEEHVVETILKNCIFPIKKVLGDLRVAYNGYWNSFESEDQLHYLIKLVIEKSLNGRKPPKARFLIDGIIKELMEEYHHIDNGDYQALINLNNCVLMLAANEFKQLPHDNKYGFTYKLPYDYDESIDTSYIRDFFLESIEEDNAVDVLFEYLGSCFIPICELNMEIIIVLLGAGSNGKSVILSLIKETLGRENVSSLELHQFNSDHKLQITIGKILNIGTEVNASKIDSSKLKSIASSEPVTVDKKYGNSFTIENFPKNIFAANSLIYNSSDLSNGFFRRLLIIPFDRVYDHTVKDPNFMPNLLTHKAAILKLIVEGAQRLLKNRQFTYSEKIDMAGKQFERSLDGTRSFVHDCQVVLPLTDSDQKYTKKSDVYDAYMLYCNAEGLEPVGRQQFYAEMKAQGFLDYKSGNNRGMKAIINNPPETPSLVSDNRAEWMK